MVGTSLPSFTPTPAEEGVVTTMLSEALACAAEYGFHGDGVTHEPLY